MKRGCGCLAAMLLLMFGLVVAVIGVGLLVGAQNKRSNFVSTSGVIVDLVGSTDSDGGSTYAPIIEFVGPGDELFRFTSNFSRSPAPEIGASVGVLYNPDDPSDATEDSVWLLFVFPIIALVIGIPMSGIGLFLVIRGLRAPDNGDLRSKTRRVVVIGEPPSTRPQPGGPTVPSSSDEEASTRPTTAQFRRVEPRGPDASGRFEYRIVARDAHGTTHYSEWLTEDPTTVLLTSGTETLQLIWRDGKAVVVGFPR